MKIKLTIILGLILMLSGWKNNQDFYQNTKPKASIKEFFSGKIKAWGIIQNWRGKVVSRFDVTMVGKWQEDEGILKEDFKFYNGKTQQRIWFIKKISKNSYEGKADDIIGKAIGKEVGTSINWKYVMDIPVDKNVYRLTLDDWMWQMNDGIMINRSYFKKFGITVAELTLFMQKQK